MRSYIPEAPTHIPLFERYHSIANNWKFSAKALKTIQDSLNAEIGTANVMIAAAGSIGRMEASNQSDVDLIVIGQSKPDVKTIHKAAESALNRSGLAPPKSDGVFSDGSTLPLLLEGVGSADENLGELARRMLLRRRVRLAPKIRSRMGVKCHVDSEITPYSLACACWRAHYMRP